MNYDNMTQQELIRKLQRECGLTDQEAANYLKYSIHTIRSWKRAELNTRGERNPKYRPMKDSDKQYIEVMIERF